MRVDTTEQRFIRLVILAVLLFYLYGVARNALVVYDDPARSVEVYWLSMTFGLAACILSLVLTWKDICKALLAFNWSNLIAITAMALYDAQHGESWSFLIYAPPTLGISLITRYICGRSAIIYGIAITIVSVVEGIAYCENVHAMFAIGLTWFAWVRAWTNNHRFGRLQYREIVLESRVVALESDVTELQKLKLHIAITQLLELCGAIHCVCSDTKAQHKATPHEYSQRLRRRRLPKQRLYCWRADELA